MFFYERALIVFLIPGHSHMIADRFVPWKKRFLDRIKIFTPDQLLKEINSVEEIYAEFISHDDNNRPCYTNWSQFLSNYLTCLPNGFTSNYVLEFYQGKVTMKHLMNEDESEAVTVNLLRGGRSFEETRRSMCRDLFGSYFVDCIDISMDDITLPRHPVKRLDLNKVISIAKKYSTIPDEDRVYYPSVDGYLKENGNYDKALEFVTGVQPPIDGRDFEDNEKAAPSAPSSARKKTRKTKTVSPGAKKRKVGMPKNVVINDIIQCTLISMFIPVTDRI